MSLDVIKFDTCAVCAGPIEIHRPSATDDDMFCSHFDHPVDEHTATPLALTMLIEATRAANEWFNAYNELRDKGDPSWDMFDNAVWSAVAAHIHQITGEERA